MNHNLSSSAQQNNTTYQSLDPRLQYGRANYVPNYATPQTYIPTIENFTQAPPVVPLELKSDDELFVETWLSKIGKINLNLESTVVQIEDPCKKLKKKKSKKPHGNLSKAKESLKKCLEITQRLEMTEKILRDNVSTMSTEEWKKHTIEIGSLKDELTPLKSHFSNSEVMKALKYDIKLRKKKRRTRKNKRIENKLQKQATVENRLQTHKKINSWLQEMKEKEEKSKAEELMNIDGDYFISEVREKKTEARKLLSFVRALIKLRTVRENAFKARGEKVPMNEGRVFADTTEKLSSVWENILKSQEEEEEGHRLLFKKTADEDVKIAKESKEKLIADQWDAVLFGPKQAVGQMYQALTLAERDFDQFIAIRKSWDTFLNAEGTKIPLGWVLPNTNPNQEWKCFRNYTGC